MPSDTVIKMIFVCFIIKPPILQNAKIWREKSALISKEELLFNFDIKQPVFSLSLWLF